MAGFSDQESSESSIASALLTVFWTWPMAWWMGCSSHSSVRL